jgi:IS30 family transposase
MAHPVQTRERLVDLVCSGLSLREAGVAVGASRQAASRWWAQCGRMELELADGRRGGLVGPVPADVPGSQGPRPVDGSPGQVQGRVRGRVRGQVQGQVQGRRCGRRVVTSEDRAVIAAGHRQGLSYAAIGVLIDRDKSVVWREVTRNASANGEYHGPVAHRVAAHHRRRPKPFKLRENLELCQRIETWMGDGWSPRLIAEVLADEQGDHRADHTGRVSHETIYQALYVQTRGHLRADLHRQLSLKRRHRVLRTRDRKASSPYKEAFKISDRPAEVADRAVPGHWEGDLIVGPESKSAIGTLVERSTRFTILLHLPGRHDANTVAEAMIREMRHLPEHLRRSITWDRGTELAEYARIQLALDTKLFFADPHSPWQRGTNENTNRLLRHWFAKGTDLSGHTAEDLARVAATLNKRPRPTLDLQTPAMRLNALLTTAA